ncbi:MAG: ATP-binding cassette domain-containing protein [Eggerthellaceae bacterium]|nr:ATP-binding cassette domain-containing protein [Eggerthellaceae bacterium]
MADTESERGFEGMKHEDAQAKQAGSQAGFSIPGEADPAALNVHELSMHEDAQTHHHHSHAAASRHTGGHHLLQVEGLSISFVMYDDQGGSFFRAKKREVPVIRDLSLSVHVGEVVAVVGASGAGKTLLADAIMGKFEPNAVVRGRIWFDGKLQYEKSLAMLRGHGISLVPQSVSALDPLMKVGKQVRGFGKGARDRGTADRGTVLLSDKAADNRTVPLSRSELFSRYGLDESVAGLYPHEVSGGMARRVLLASALIDQPKVIIADEPTVGLDLDLAVRALSDFREFADAGNGVILITHNIELALRVADRVAVFQDGTVVEETAVANFASPDLLTHPFSKALWHALPEHDFTASEETSSDGEEGGAC